MQNLLTHLDLIAAFHQVAQDGSFTQAATSLNSSKSQVSKQIKTLESLLQTQLLHRTTRSLRLTEAGEALFRYSTEIQALFRQATEVVNDLNADTVGVLRFTCPVSLGISMMPEILKLFRLRYPRVKVQIDLANESRNLIAEEFDLAIRATPQPDPYLIARPLGAMVDAICASPEFIARHGRPETPEELTRFPCIAHNQHQQLSQWRFTGPEREISVPIQAEIAANQYPMMRQCAVEGLGVTKLPFYEAYRDIESGRLVRLLEDYPSHTHTLYVVFPAQRYQPKKLIYFKELLIEWFSGRPEFFHRL
ncbi:LysR family transcriptional regulator [Hahella sp. HN01]|uniref:LysR family transcriptional regulator n=1 Tax=Hahella sp. HN01 TaxID=2847262 RepID=UPI001C1E9407|nr:LysR family transcriptional regulator [Hahella sp. HN01]MBU6951916.1 LysR family transcriptional regulator [Hahella sp. HN01]